MATWMSRIGSRMSEVREARVGRIRKLRLLAFASTLLSGLASERSLAKKGSALDASWKICITPSIHAVLHVVTNGGQHHDRPLVQRQHLPCVIRSCHVRLRCLLLSGQSSFALLGTPPEVPRYHPQALI